MIFLHSLSNFVHTLTNTYTNYRRVFSLTFRSENRFQYGFGYNYQYRSLERERSKNFKANSSNQTSGKNWLDIPIPGLVLCTDIVAPHRRIEYWQKDKKEKESIHGLPHIWRSLFYDPSKLLVVKIVPNWWHRTFGRLYFYFRTSRSNTALPQFKQDCYFPRWKEENLVLSITKRLKTELKSYTALIILK